MKTSVIFTTYNSPEWLAKVLWGFSCQTQRPDEIVIADDGSTDKTRQRIDELRTETGLNLLHVWQQDDGFQKTRILNKAITHSTGDYLIFTDGDCIPRADFVEQHCALAKNGHFLSGGYFKLPMQTSSAIAREDIVEQRCFDVDWLNRHGLAKTYKTAKLTARGWKAQLYNALTPTGATWNGHNASGWKEDIVAANGFDERMKYGGEDRELGERLFNAGVKSRQLRYSLVVVHLDHARGYVDRTAWDFNFKVRKKTRRTGRTKTNYGIQKPASE
jgi:glycosyltransferase involved in cell wall biosynthesis